MVNKKIIGLVFLVFFINFISALTIDFPVNGENITGAVIGTTAGQIVVGIVILLILIGLGYLIVRVNKKDGLDSEARADLKRLKKSRDSENPVLGKQTNPIFNKLDGKEIDESKIKDLGDLN